MAAKILKKSTLGVYSVQDEMAGRVPERDFMDFSDRDFARAGEFHTLSQHRNVPSVSRSTSLTHSSSSSERQWYSTEAALLATDGFDANRAFLDSVTEPGTSLVTSPTIAKPGRQPRTWKGPKLVLQQASEYLRGTLQSMREEAAIIGAFDTNQQKSGALKAFVPLEEYSDARRREIAKASFRDARDRFFEQTDPVLMEEDASAAFLEKPEAYATFRDLEFRCKTLWQNRDALAFEEAISSERPVIEVVTPTYCDEFRFPQSHSPLSRASERRLCRNANQCICNTMHPEHGYVAIEFLTPREDRHFTETGQYMRSVPHLCIDCELAWYTERFYFACRTNDTGVTSAINRFRVLCEEGGYDKRTMLPNMLGSNTLTGIVGMVPTFDEKYRSYILVDGSTSVYRVTEVNVGF